MCPRKTETRRRGKNLNHVRRKTEQRFLENWHKISRLSSRQKIIKEIISGRNDSNEAKAKLQSEELLVRIQGNECIELFHTVLDDQNRNEKKKIANS